ncbi:hypothetical protein [Actinomyces bowdenii]|uniref:Uncharacterized protein n=1 Tax=Actinomyces bowdenii TaxID=131109 RepID=A0A3P1VB74_9ACTO|nr:hypothetical protein [Actinomyces bowdenii]RRD30866.1 hypothetical protein EII10_01865 [Actinomyces bowdenii]
MIVLSPDGLRVFQEGKEDIYVPWRLSPQVMGVRVRNGVAFIKMQGGNVLPIGVRLRLTPISYVRLEQLISFYVSHPELRHELATKAGLARVKDLMNRYPWDIEEDLRTSVEQR